MQLRDIATGYFISSIDETAKFLLDTDPLFSMAVNFYQENKLLKERIAQLEEAESLRRIQDCTTT